MNIDNLNSLINNISILIKDVDNSDDLILLSLFSELIIKKRNSLLYKELKN